MHNFLILLILSSRTWMSSWRWYIDGLDKVKGDGGLGFKIISVLKIEGNCQVPGLRYKPGYKPTSYPLINPGGPGGPGGPTSPFRPGSPSCPDSPLSPGTPWTPVSPGSPLDPLSPFIPLDPWAPSGPGGP